MLDPTEELNVSEELIAPMTSDIESVPVVSEQSVHVGNLHVTAVWEIHLIGGAVVPVGSNLATTVESTGPNPVPVSVTDGPLV